MMMHARSMARRVGLILAMLLAVSATALVPSASATSGLGDAGCVFAGYVVLDSTLSVNGGPDPDLDVTACSMPAGMVQVQVMTAAGGDLDTSGLLDVDDVLAITVALPEGATTAGLVTSGGVTSLANSEGVVTIVGHPQAVSWYVDPLNPIACRISTDADANLCNHEVATDDMPTSWVGMLQTDASYAGVAAIVVQALDGAWVSTNAQAFGILPDPGGGISISLAGPYLTKAGMPNTGSLTVFLPTATLTTLMGFADLAGVNASTLEAVRAEQGLADFTVPDWAEQVEQVDGGVLVSIAGVHFSSPVYTIRKVTSSPPPAPSKPRQLALSSPARHALKVTWSAPANSAAAQVDGFRVRLYRAGAGTVATRLPGGTSTRFNRLRVGRYSVKVWAHGTSGWSPYASGTFTLRR